jgi:hypothetical protein
MILRWRKPVSFYVIQRAKLALKIAGESGLRAREMESVSSIKLHREKHNNQL